MPPERLILTSYFAFCRLAKWLSYSDLLSSGAEGESRTHDLPITKRHPASLNKRLSNLFNDLTVRHCQSLPVISHRLAQV